MTRSRWMAPLAAVALLAAPFSWEAIAAGPQTPAPAAKRASGLYQFSVATWQSVGGAGLPSQASPAEQTTRAQILQARSGWGQWPACSRKLGLR